MSHLIKGSNTFSFSDLERNINITKYANGEAKITIFPTRRAQQCSHHQDEPERQERLAKQRIYRRKKAVYDSIRQINADRMLTLTFRQNIEDYDQAIILFRYFCRQAKKRALIGHHMGVPETQKRGSWHLHIALKGYIKISQIRSLWQNQLLRHGLEGQVNVTSHKGGFKKRTRSLANYLSKYLTKDLECSYVRSRGIPKPEIIRTHLFMSAYAVSYLEHICPQALVKSLDHGVFLIFCDHETVDVFTERILINYQ